MDIKKAFPLIIAVACGILALVLLGAYINNKELEIKKKLEYQLKQAQLKSGVSLKKTNIVLIAKQAIPPRTLITATDVSIQQLPKERINPAAAVSLEEVLGYISNKTIPKGKQILKTNLTALDNKGTKKLPILIPEGKKAIPVLIENFSNMINIIQPGNYVDVFTTLPSSTGIPMLEKLKSGGSAQTTLLLFQNIRVSAMGKEDGSDSKKYGRQEQNKKIAKSQTASLILNAQEIKVLSFIQSQNGKITLALRALGETSENSLEPIDWDFLFRYLNKKPRTTVEIYHGTEKEIVPLIPKEAAE